MTIPTLQRFKKLILILALLLVTAATAAAVVPADTRGPAPAEPDKKKEAIKLIRTESLDRAGEEVSRRVDDWAGRGGPANRGMGLCPGRAGHHLDKAPFMPGHFIRRGQRRANPSHFDPP